MLISIVVPFYNSRKKSLRLIKTLSSISDGDVEVICVDDGSSDGTPEFLEERLTTDDALNFRIIKQANRGPGGARNTGLNHACGKYVWFVDSDDDINLDVIRFIRRKVERGCNPDFFDFNIVSTVAEANSMALKEGGYDVDDKVREMLLEKFGRICSKIFKRSMLVGNKIFYIGDCFADDNALPYIYPFYVKSFLKSELVGYYHHQEFESITRGDIGFKYFDRLHAASCGLERAMPMARSCRERTLLEKKFTQQFFFNTLRRLLGTRNVSNIFVAFRVSRHYRFFSKKFGFRGGPMVYGDRSRKFNAIAFGFYFISFALPDQKYFFEEIRMKGWGRPFPFFPDNLSSQ